MGGEETQNTNQSGTSTWAPIQSENYEQLLKRADDWLSAGGIQLGTDYTGQMQGIIGDSAAAYREMMGSTVDQEMLQRTMDATAGSVQRNFERNVMPAIGGSFQETGSGMSSRRGIAEGLAVSDMNQQIVDANARLAYQAEQDNMQRRMAGAQGLQGLMSDYQSLSDLSQARQNSYLESLMAYQSLISGNLGGTESSTGSSSTVAKGGGLF